MVQACRARAPRAFAPRCSNGRFAVVVRAHIRDAAQASAPRAAGAALLAAATVFLSVVPALSPADLMLRPAHADDEVSEELLTPYQRRQRDLERRREMLRQTREAAEVKAGVDVAAPSTAEADAAIEAANAERRAAANQLGSQLKSSAAATYESTTGASRYRGFGGFSSTPAPPPAVEPEAEAPAPKASFFRQEPKPEPVEVKKAAPAPAPVKKAEEPKKQQQKRRGPLPLFVAEVLVLGSFAAFVLSVTKYADQSSKVLALAGAKGKELFTVAEAALAKAQKGK